MKKFVPKNLVITGVEINGSFITDKTILTDKFNKYFLSVHSSQNNFYLHK